MQIIKFVRIPPRYFYVDKNGVNVPIGEIAFSEEHLFAKLGDDMAEIQMPAKPWYVRLWRRIFPLKGIEMDC